MALELSAKDKLDLFRELAGVGTNISLWQYASDGHLVSTNCEHLTLDRFFENSGCKSYMLENASHYTAPLILSGPMGLMWSAVFRLMPNQAYNYYVLGPVFSSELSEKKIREFARQFNIDLTWREGFINLLESLPVVSSILFFQYSLMLHYCVTGEKLERNSLHFQRGSSEYFGDTAPRGDRMQTWLAERELLRMVREGNLNYQQALRRVGLLSTGVQSGSSDPALQALISGVTFTALCTREAIQAGLSPDTAYSVGDHYIRNMVESRNVAEIGALDHAMYEDFIRRVHKLQLAPAASNHIRACVDYIELHAEDELSLEILAKRTGYTEYHLSRKFHKEMGVTISNYIRMERINQAMRYLTGTDETIAQIADRFRFSSASHFSGVFKEITGMKPAEYRAANRRI